MQFDFDDEKMEFSFKEAAMAWGEIVDFTGPETQKRFYELLQVLTHAAESGTIPFQGTPKDANQGKWLRLPEEMWAGCRLHRDDLLAFAESRGEKPRFLYPETRGNQVNPKLRNQQRHQARVRALAEYFWSLELESGPPYSTKKEMTKRPELRAIGCEENDPINGRSYGIETLEEWIKDLNPDRKPGRRPKKPRD